MTIRIPVDLASADSVPDWQNCFRWPVPLVEAQDVTFSAFGRFLKAVETVDGDAAALACHTGRLTGELLLALDSVKLVQSAREKGIELVGGPPAVSALLSAGPSDAAAFTKYSQLPQQLVKHVRLREAARAASWSKGLKVIPALFNPKVTAFSHNALLRAEAEHAGFSVGFRHGFDLMERTAVQYEKSLTQDIQRWKPAVDTVLALAAQVVSDAENLDPRLLVKARDLLVAVLEPLLWSSAQEIETARRIPNLPSDIWIASAGQPKIRALSLEVRRRGGRVTGFEHAGCAGLMADNFSLLTSELIIEDEFCTSTPEIAGMLSSNAAMAKFDAFRSTKIRAGRGDPTFAKKPTSQKRGRNGGKPNVLYVVGAFDGARRRVPPSLTDPVKMVWWRETADEIMKLPVNFKMQVHPGGSLPGKSNPLKSQVPTTDSRYEQAEEWADVIVIDVTQSTTLTLSLCSDKHLVLIDYKRNVMYDGVLERAKRRASIVSVEYDERGVPRVDADGLRDAVLGDPVSLDGGEFRKLYAGEYA